MEQSPWEANWFSASQEILAFYGTRRFITTFTHINLYQVHSLFWAYHSWGIKQGLGIVTCNTDNLIVIGLVCVFIEVFLSALHFRVTCCPTFRACTPFLQVPYVTERPVEGPGNIRHLREWGTSSKGGAIIWHVGCIALSVLTFFQFGENTQWIMDGFALGRMHARRVDIDHLCTKPPWV
jgi:hypothetical protein